MKAYVLVQTETKRAPIASAMRTISGVTGAEDLSGPYDAIAFADFDPEGRPIDAIVEDIATLPHVIHAIAAPVVGSLVGASTGAAA